MASSFRDLNSSAGIPSHPLALLTAVLLNAHFHFALQNVWLWVTNLAILVIQFIKIFFIQFFHVFFHLFLISSVSTRLKSRDFLFSFFFFFIYFNWRPITLQYCSDLNRDITLLTKVHIVKAMVFPVVTYGRKSWTIKKTECQRIDAFELWCWGRLLKVPWTARRSNQSILRDQP